MATKPGLAEFVMRLQPDRAMSDEDVKACVAVANCAMTLVGPIEMRSHIVRRFDGKIVYQQDFKSHAEEAAPILAVRLNPEGFKLRPGIANFLDEFLPKVIAEETAGQLPSEPPLDLTSLDVALEKSTQASK